MIAKLAAWLRATALILSLRLPVPTFDISATGLHHIWPSHGKESTNVAVFVIIGDILRTTQTTFPQNPEHTFPL